MTPIVILGAGIGGVPMAFEMHNLLEPGEHITVVSDSPSFQFVPSNPWVVARPPRGQSPAER